MAGPPGPRVRHTLCADVIVILRASYLIGYLPPDGDDDLREHTVRVRSRPGFRLVHRPTYWR